ncbi:MAG: hypothetical protein LWW92_04775, partial [Rhodocyclales bacterium]|nr:hypothetical protein [Rhodocyclales bacterium]
MTAIPSFSSPSRLLTTLALGSSLLTLSGCANMQMGAEEAKTTATGSAGGANTQNANAKLEKCDAPLGTITVVEDTNAPWYGMLTGQMKLGSTVPVINGLTDRSHPCQILADLQTIEEHSGPVAGKTIAWIGDGNNVCHSFMHAAPKFGFHLNVACPAEYHPDLRDLEKGGAAVTLTS